MNASLAKFRQAVTEVHRAKNAAYRDAWKKRGEVLGILANIARKVDRIESVVNGAVPTADESFLDTAIDLFVYCLKYETFLADLDASIAARLLRGATIIGPHSCGTDGFDYLLAQLDLSALDTDSTGIEASASEAIARFADLQKCFSGLETNTSVAVRLDNVKGLLDASVRLIAALRRVHAASYEAFLRSNKG